MMTMTASFDDGKSCQKLSDHDATPIAAQAVKWSLGVWSKADWAHREFRSSAVPST